MKKIWKAIACSSLIFAGCCVGNLGQAEASENMVNYYYQGKEISLNKAINIASKYDVVFFDEYHDQRDIHQAELDFLQGFYQKNKDMILSMEMFERDVQPLMNDYLNNKISEQDFVQNSRPWANYQEDYRPLVEFAKKQGLYVLASNIPRRIANQYTKVGDLALIDEADKQYLPQKHLVEHGAYYDKFVGYMSMGEGQGHMQMSKAKIEAFYKAQCLKDDTMAESIVLYKNAHKDIKILHVQGAFHGDSHLGVVEKVNKLNNSLKTLVITPIEAKNFDKNANYNDKNTIIMTFTRK